MRRGRSLDQLAAMNLVRDYVRLCYLLVVTENRVDSGILEAGDGGHFAVELRLPVTRRYLEHPKQRRRVKTPKGLLSMGKFTRSQSKGGVGKTTTTINQPTWRNSDKSIAC